MRSHDFSSGTTFKINLLMLQAFLSGAIAWVLWPEKLIDWGWGLLSILLWACCIACSFNAIAETYNAYKRDKKIEAMLALGPQPKTSKITTDNDLDKAGML